MSYKLELTKERLAVYINGLDSSVRLLAQQMGNAPSAGFALKELLPKLIQVNQEFDELQKLVDAQDKLPSDQDVPA